MIGPMTQAEYLKDRAIHCPICWSEHVDSLQANGTAIADTDYAFRNMLCKNCGATWDADYKLAGYSELEMNKESVAAYTEEELEK